MAKHDLTGSLEREFTFSIDGKEFSFRKPTVREMREVAKVFSSAGSVEDPDEQAKKTDEAMGTIYAFITPIGHDERVADVMDNQPVSVQIAFNEMIQEELGAK